MDTKDSCVRIAFSFGESSNIQTEVLLARPIGEGLYLLENSPFYVYGISYQDVAAASECDGQLKATGVVRRGGHSTYRVRLKETATTKQFQRAWSRLEHLGCTYEESLANATPLFSIDVPPGVDVNLAYQELEAAEEDGIWEFEEGHFAARQ
jgi:Domain of unknown function (DUF4265)